MAFDAHQVSDDSVLLQRFAEGDRTAASTLTTRLAPIILAHAFRLLNNRAEAEDVTQDALMRLWKAAPDWEPDRAHVTTWLYRVTANLCIDRIRKSKRYSGDEVPDLVDGTPGVASQLQTQERKSALHMALTHLPDRQRQAIILRHIEDLSNPEIAQIMEISVEAVESLLARGKRALAAILAPKKQALGLEND